MTRVGGGVKTPPQKDDIISEQPLIHCMKLEINTESRIKRPTNIKFFSSVVFCLPKSPSSPCGDLMGGTFYLYSWGRKPNPKPDHEFLFLRLFAKAIFNIQWSNKLSSRPHDLFNSPTSSTSMTGLMAPAPFHCCSKSTL